MHVHIITLHHQDPPQQNCEIGKGVWVCVDVHVCIRSRYNRLTYTYIYVLNSMLVNPRRTLVGIRVHYRAHLRVPCASVRKVMDCMSWSWCTVSPIFWYAEITGQYTCTGFFICIIFTLLDSSLASPLDTYMYMYLCLYWNIRCGFHESWVETPFFLIFAKICLRENTNVYSMYMYVCMYVLLVHVHLPAFVYLFSYTRGTYSEH